MAKHSVRKVRGNRRGVILAVIFAVLAIAFFTYRILDIKKENDILRQNQEVLKENIEEESAKQEELQKKVGKGLTEQDIIRIAREKFGLVFPNEIIFVPEEK